jgi:serine/threonine-protein kinase
VGERFGRYELLRRIAIGGMAEIFLARETGLAGFERLVIIKRVLPSLAEDMDFIDMFLDEARLAARLTHPNIVHIYELGEENGAYYIAMEYVPGGDLHELLGRHRGRLVPLGEALYTIGEICAGLQFAHALASPDGELLGVVHRDVTPKNVLLSVDGLVKVVDFGIAKARAKLSVTRPGDIKGTFSYMAPEQARGEKIDRRADVYAVGALTYRLVTGTPAYPQVGDSLLSAVRASQFVRPRMINPQVPPQVEEIILRAMALEPKDRFATCGALRREVADVSRQLGLSSDGETLSQLVRTTFPLIPGVTAPLDEQVEPPSARSTRLETPLRQALQPAGPDESTGLVQLPQGYEVAAQHQTARGGAGNGEIQEAELEDLMQLDPDDEGQTDMVLLPEQLQPMDVSDGDMGEPTHIMEPGVGAHPSHGDRRVFGADLDEPTTEPAAIPPMGGASPYASPAPYASPTPYASPAAHFVVAPPSSAAGFVGPAPPLPFQSPGLGAPLFPVAAPPPAIEQAQPAEPAVTPTFTPIVRGRSKQRKRSTRGILLIVSSFTVGVILIAVAVALFTLPPTAAQPELVQQGLDTTAQAGLGSPAELPGLAPDVDSSLIQKSPPPPDAAPLAPPALDAGAPAADAGPTMTDAAPTPTALPDAAPTLAPEPPPPPMPELPPVVRAPTKEREPSTPRTPVEPRVVKVASAPPEPPVRPPVEKTPPGDETPAAAKRNVGYLTVFTTPSSKVYLGSKLIGNSPIANKELPVGRYTLKLVSPDRPEKTVRITITAGEPTRVRERL